MEAVRGVRPDMPTTGTGTYRGVAGFAAGNGNYGPAMSDATLVAQAELNADFGAGKISGDLTNFRDDQNQAIAGRVQIRDGHRTGPSANTYNDAVVVGSLTLDGTPSEVRGRMDSQFRGADAQMINGNIRNLKIGDQDYTGRVLVER